MAAAPTRTTRTTRSTIVHPSKQRQSTKPKLKLNHVIGGLVVVICLIYGFVQIHFHSNNATAATVDHDQVHVVNGVGKPTNQHITISNTKQSMKTVIISEKANQERPNQHLRENEQLSKVEARIKTTFKTTNSKPCHWFNKDPVTGESIRTLDEACKDASNLVAYNSLKQPRYLCGKEVPPGGFLLMSEACAEPTRVFLNEPQLHPKPDFEPPMEVVADSKTGKPTKFDCNVPCNKWGGDPIVGTKWIDQTDWRFKYSMEGTGYYGELILDSMAWKDNQFYATTSFKSEVPLPYFSWAEYSIQKPALNFTKAIKGASFIARNCGSNNNRETVVSDLIKIMRVDSLSTCLHNAEPPNGMSMTSKAAVQREYLFHLAFENTCEEDYITEKLWGTFESGTIPVYYGAPNVQDHAPPNSIISWHDFNDTTKLGEYLLKVADDQALYESYHAWRYKPLPEVFVNKFNFTHTHSICRMCRWAYARKFGFGWNHTYQNVQETRVPRKVCTDSLGLLVHPFQERWISHGSVLMEAADEKGTCGEIEPTLQIESGMRRVWSHDGVLDLFVDGVADDSLELELKTPIKADLQEKAPNHFVFKDAYSRYTILTRAHGAAHSEQAGVLCLDNLQVGFTLRVIIEDLDTFHMHATDQVSHFAALMISDFLQPVEFYLAEGATRLKGSGNA